ncbi:ABC transporter ATP-binding protein [Xylocopilactobacillus apicola]|uniref:Putative hemin import ATP-binding protein HrtA n=1 Tax=Xylocopilactobacillus apicola TaxID=2932184 RepID=A0AAU9DX82_9LACO|nr:ABC transporter ATP-binding protein [Xylocopilactobacillus apicola]BDR58713.1 ABC transporter ATP-binding protein [Xylocopilactobacillus apicola]
MAVITLKNVSKTFGSKTSKVEALKNVNFSAERGEVSLVLGPSGSGKSTFLTIAGGLQAPTTGKVMLDGISLAEISEREKEQVRLNKIGFVLQSYNLVPFLTVKEQFEFVSKVKKTGNLSSDELNELLSELGIADFSTKYPGELSGGQAQRVSIARALYPNPSIIFADEPTAALDSPNVKVVGEMFQSEAKKRDKTIVVVTHDMRLKDYCDHIFEIMDGKMTQKN